MPLLDVSELLTDPDFVDYDLTYTRLSQTVNENGIAVDNAVTLPFEGVVTSATGSMLDRLPDGERVRQSIRIITQTRLQDGMSGYSADIVTWDCREYTVVQVDNYSKYGHGFVQAVCDLIPMSG